LSWLVFIDCNPPWANGEKKGENILKRGREGGGGNHRKIAGQHLVVHRKALAGERGERKWGEG